MATLQYSCLINPMDRGAWRATPWTAACQASLSFTISQSLLKLMSTESMIPSNHLILRVAAGFSSYDGDLSLPLGLALESPIFPSGCEGKLGVALESLQGLRDLT